MSEAKEAKGGAKGGEAKGGDAKGREVKGGELIPSAVLEFLEDEGGTLNQAIEIFCEEHAHAFEAESKSEMYQCSYTEIHENFKKMVEDHLAEFIDKKGLSIIDFVELIKSEPSHPLLRSIEATTDFDVFVMMMREVKEHGW
jgi:hypothetical protein